MPVIPFRSSVEQWRDLFTREAPDLPTDFLLKWLDMESGGNPCSTGIPGREAGIFQTDHPGDDRFGASFAQLRQGCSGQQIVDRSAVDFALQARHGLNFVRAKRDQAILHMRMAGVDWPSSSTDFWTVVKQEHALPCVAGDLLSRFTRVNGRPARSWDEFRDWVNTLSPSEAGSCAGFVGAPSLHGLRNRLMDTLRNAEEAGKFGGGVLAVIGTLGKAGPFLLLGAAATLLYLLWRR